MDKTILPDNKYKYASSGYYWGRIITIDRKKSEARVLTAGNGGVTFGLYELQAWINEGILVKIN